MSSSSLIEFLVLIGRLKHIQRTGWVQRRVKDPESIAGHMYRMAVMSFLVDQKCGLSKERCIKLSLVHDMAECIVGDITPADNVTKEEKHVREKEAMDKLKSLIPPEVGQEIFQLWKEYEHQSSPEAIFVKDVDKFDMILQAYEYEQQDKGPGKLQDFYDSTQGKFQTDQVKQWAEELYRLRQKTISVDDS